MKDLNHYFGGDLIQSANGDLLSVDGAERGKQRILRRLLTNPGDYIWHPDYGAGLPRYVGQTIDISKMTALITGQVLMEDAVAKTPRPVVTVTAITNGMAVNISYADAQTKTTQTLSFDVNK